MKKKQVVLLGDSIRGSYQSTVEQQLADVAEVWAPTENCGNTVNLLVNLHAWVINRDPRPDLVHINAGLHDLRTIRYGGRENVVPVDHYRRNVEALLRTIREQTGAQLLWATTTPLVYEHAHHHHAAWRDFDRYEEDVANYNAAAVQVCRQLNVPVNDLHAIVMAAGKEKLLCEDGVHFTPAGAEHLGKEVADQIRRWLTS